MIDLLHGQPGRYAGERVLRFHELVLIAVRPVGAPDGRGQCLNCPTPAEAPAQPIEWLIPPVRAPDNPQQDNQITPRQPRLARPARRNGLAHLWRLRCDRPNDARFVQFRERYNLVLVETVVPAIMECDDAVIIEHGDGLDPRDDFVNVHLFFCFEKEKKWVRTKNKSE